MGVKKMNFTIKNESIQRYNGIPNIEFPKYTSQLINWANQNAQGTRPKVVGQLSDLFPKFQNSTEDISIEKWVRDLVVYKTYNGLYVQQAILASLAERVNESFRLATQEEESKGIDGFVGTTPYSIKPDTYKTMGRLSEMIDVKMIYYTKTKTGFKIEVDE